MQLTIDLNSNLSSEEQQTLIDFLNNHNHIKKVTIKKSSSKPKPDSQSPKLREEWLNHSLTQETLAKVLRNINPTIRINSYLREGDLIKAFQQTSKDGEVYGYLANIKPLDRDEKGYKIRIKGVKSNFSLERFISWCGAFGLTSKTKLNSERAFFYTDISHINYEIIKQTSSFLDVEVFFSKTKKGKLILKSDNNNTQEDSNNGSPTPNQTTIPTTLTDDQSRVTSSIQSRLRLTNRASRVR